jgi:TonB family protein
MKNTILITLASFLFAGLTVFGESECGVFANSECCKAPSVVKFSQPQLPSDLLKPGETAEIIIRCAIDEDGKLVGTKTISSSHQVLESIVVKAMANWEFDAALEKGEKQRATINVPFRFNVAAR